MLGGGLVTLGVVVFAMGHRQVVHTAPLIQVVPSYKADASNIINAIAAANHIAANRRQDEIRIGIGGDGSNENPYY